MPNRGDLLRKISNISADCSDIESDATSFEKLSYKEVAQIQRDISENEDNNEESVTEEEYENIINIPRFTELHK